ncbi:MAG: LCP family protein [Patescibacteria group bacterium]
MIEFRTKKIRKNIPQEKKKEPETEEEIISKKSRRKVQVSVAIIFAIIIFLFIGIIKTISSIDFTIFLKVAGEDLKKDAYGHTNFLLLGTGGGDHEGSDLTDSIIVASIDNESKLITMVSIPRDLYVKDPEVGNSRINEVYFNAKKYYESSSEGLSYMQKKVEEIMGIPIHYWIKLDFTGFKDLVDAIGGIDIYVKETIYDPYYPKDGTFLYETFSLPEGQHHLDGETALKYARSRKTTSDFDRADRQQQIIYAVKEKALQTKTLLSKDKITAVLDAVKENIETNITVKELLTLGAIAGDYSPDKILHKLIHDDPTQCGGFLYTPSREFYNGMFILLPAGGFNFIHLYSDLNFNSPKIAVENSKIQILNGTKRNGAAGETKQILKRFCFDIIRFGNAGSKDVIETTYYYKQDSRPEAMNFLQKIIPGKESTILPQEYIENGYTEADILLELGSSYTESDKYVKDPFYYLPAATPSTPTAPAESVPASDSTSTQEAPTTATPQI